MDRLFKICNSWDAFHNGIETIKFYLVKKRLPFLNNKVIKKYLNHKFSSNQNQLKTHLTFVVLSYYISSTFHTILKINFQNFAKIFVNKILTFKKKKLKF